MTDETAPPTSKIQLMQEIQACMLAYEVHAPHYDELLTLLSRCGTELERLTAQIAICAQDGVACWQEERDRLRAALERIANPTREGAWETRPVSYDFVRLAGEALRATPETTEVWK